MIFGDGPLVYLHNVEVPHKKKVLAEQRHSMGTPPVIDILNSFETWTGAFE